MGLTLLGVSHRLEESRTAYTDRRERQREGGDRELRAMGGEDLADGPVEALDALLDPDGTLADALDLLHGVGETDSTVTAPDRD